MDIQFLNADVAAAYEPVANFDVEIHTKGYSGLLSRLTLVGAKSMIATKSQYIRIKEVAAAPPIVEPVVEPIVETAPIVEPAISEAIPAPEPIVEHSAQEQPAEQQHEEHDEHL